METDGLFSALILKFAPFSDTIQTNRGAPRDEIARGIRAAGSPVVVLGLRAWGRPVPRERAAGGTWPGPREGRPRGHPWAPGSFARWRVGEPGNVPPPAQRPCLSPAPLPPGPPGARARPPLLGKFGGTSGPRDLSAPAPLECSPRRVPAGFPPGIPRAFRGEREEQRPVERGGQVPPAGRRGERARCEEARRPAVRAPRGLIRALPAGKLQSRKARVGQNPRADGPAPLPIPIHPARPVTTSLSLQRRVEERSRKINPAAQERQPRSAGGSSEPGGSVPLGPRAPGAPPPRGPRPRHPSPGPPPMWARPRRPRRRASRPLALGFQRRPRGVGGELGGDRGARRVAGPQAPRGTPGRSKEGPVPGPAGPAERAP